MANLLRRLLELNRDWRFRTVGPVVIIHLIAFGLMYTLMYRFAMKNLESNQKASAQIVLDNLEFNFQDGMAAHNGVSLQSRIERQATAHKLTTLTVYDQTAQPIAFSGPAPSGDEVSVAQVILANPAHPALWLNKEDGKTYLFGIRVLKNDAACRTCHDAHARNLGVIQMGVDLTAQMALAREKMKKKFMWVGLGWFALLLVMIAIRVAAIGRPLAQIERSLSEAESTATRRKRRNSHDLDALASHLHGTLWNIIERQRLREENIARQMVRAEQLASLGEMAAGLTHEIKNPIAGVTAALELLRNDHSVVSETPELVGQMLSELRRVSGTVDALLRLAKPRPPERMPMALDSLVREIALLFDARLRRQGVALHLELAEGLPTLPLDRTLITQLLVNLLTNSLQATERGGNVRVQLAPFPHRDGVILAVSDNGKGIAADQLERVFDPFFTTKEEGTGLGLAICRQIVDQHGGAINIESEAGKGTRVIVLLPASQEATTGQSDGIAAAG